MSAEVEMRSPPVADIPIACDGFQGGECVKIATGFKLLAFIAFLAWEAWWTYEFITAPRPDGGMSAVFAVSMAVLVPALLALLVGAADFFWRLRKEPMEEPD
jgi:hypothetical protein